MKRIITFLSLFILSLFLVSCGLRNETAFDKCDSYLLEIGSEEFSSDTRLVLKVEKAIYGFVIRFSEPDDLSDVTACYENGNVVLRSNNTEIALDKDSSAGFTIVIKTIERIILSGVNKGGESFDYDGFYITIDPPSDPDRICFSVSDGFTARSCVLSKTTDKAIERSPGNAG